MKKLLFLLSAAAFLAIGSVNAQVIFAKSRTPYAVTNPTADTLTNADTIYNVVRAGGLFNASVQIDVNTVSGTLAGIAYVYGSVTGGNYSLLDTAAFSGAAFTRIYQFNPCPYQYFKVAYISSGTSVSKPATYGLFRAVAQ